MSNRQKHRFPERCDYIATEAIDGNYYIAYHLDYLTGEFDVDRVGFGHGSSVMEAIEDLRERTRQ
jgi:hypothetical protein